MSYLSPKLIVANWKMYGLSQSLCEIEQIYRGLGPAFSWDSRVVMCLPASLIFRANLHLESVMQLPKKNFSFGGQDCHFEEAGAYTGDISAAMLKDAGADYVILGHSERRTVYKETSEKIYRKAAIAFKHQLVPIICIGETEEQREAGDTFAILEEQLLHSVPFDGLEVQENCAPFVVAYEPVWAIGTGKIPQSEEILEVHGYLRRCLIQEMGKDKGQKIPLLYGGSVKKDNASTILTLNEVNGVLVGGASLKAKDFLPICDNA